VSLTYTVGALLSKED